jgi:hypothetical protein
VLRRNPCSPRTRHLLTMLFRWSQWVGVSVLVYLFVEFKRLSFPPGIKITADVLFQCPVNGGPSKLIANNCCGQALAKSWEGLW